MGYAELIERLQALSHDKQVEVFDFVEFLSAQCAKEQAHERGEWSDAEFAALAMAQAMRGREDDAVTYALSDLQERWQ